VSRTIQHGGNLARDAHAASGIFVELALTGLGYDNFGHSLSRFLISGTEVQLSAFSRQLLASALLRAVLLRSLCCGQPSFVSRQLSVKPES
jgi:hypothetical protein